MLRARFRMTRSVRTLALALAVVLAGFATPAAAQDDRVVAEDLIPAVVLIVVTDCPAAADPADDDPDLIEAVIDTGDGDCDWIWTGSGVVVDPSGLILTDRSNLFGSEEPGSRGEWRWVWIGMTDDPRDGLEYRYLARPVADDPDLDLGLVQIAYDARGRAVDPDDLDLTALPLAVDTEDLRIGDPLRAIGYPTVSNYRVVVIEVRVAGYMPDYLDPDTGEDRMVNTSPPVGYGAVGGPVVDDDGRVIGLIASIVPSDLDCWEQDGDDGIDPVTECKGTPVSVQQVRRVDQIHPFLEEAIEDLADRPDARAEDREEDEDDA